MLELLADKLKESAFSIIPIIILVLILNFTIAPMSIWGLILFLISSFFMVLGITLFNLGVDVSMIPIGEQIGSSLVKTRNLTLIILVTFIIGIFITIAEPDLIVLAGQINGVPDSIIILSVAIGVALALVAAFMRILFQLPLSYILISCYILAFILSTFTGKDFISIAWESGGVSTGPIMVPFVMALGLGLASIRGDKTTEEDSFGLISLCLIGPILIVLILGMFFEPSGGSAISASENQSISDIITLYGQNLPKYFLQVAIALFPMIFLFAIFNIFRLNLRRSAIYKIGMGTIYTYIGLVLFLTSANVGFMPAGYSLGSSLIENNSNWVLIAVGIAIGFFVVAAEPAVFVLKRQVEEVTTGAISAKFLGIGLSIGVGIAVGLSMIRVITGISILYFLIPGYVFALVLTFFVPRLFISIAFDSGAVASGPLAATFMLPFAIGASETTGGNVYSDAFGIVALVAMLPVITLQIFGLSYVIKSNIARRSGVIVPMEDDIIVEVDYDENEQDLSCDVIKIGGEDNLGEDDTEGDK
jgi:hypothetical protein